MRKILCDLCSGEISENELSRVTLFHFPGRTDDFNNIHSHYIELCPACFKRKIEPLVNASQEIDISKYL